MPSTTDTIAAFSTALGGAVAIVRISGPETERAVSQVWSGSRPLSAEPHRQLRLGRITDEDGKVADNALAVFMPGPRSYTGEDMAEIHCHGGALSARVVLLLLLKAGARHAEAGEFTKRAFLNGKLDLTQAEAVADIIQAHSEAALHLANRQLDGLLGRRVNAAYDRLEHLLSEIESRMDFPEEDLDWMSPADLDRGLSTGGTELDALLASRTEGDVLRQGVQLVIAGPPNVGKSSLMNAILGRDRAIVTHIPGTTRDTLEELAHIRGIPVRLVDTAGIRDAEDLVERTGIERSFESIRMAQIVLWVVDASQDPTGQQPPPDVLKTGIPVVMIGNKMDLRPPGTTPLPGSMCATCAVTGHGLEALFDAIEEAVWNVPHTQESDVAVSARHAALLDEAVPLVADARARVSDEEWELAAVSLHGALAAIGHITGRTAAPDVLESIFSRFCIGK